MTRNSKRALVGLAVVSAAALGWAVQVSVPDVEAYQNKTFDAFDELAKMGAYVVDDEGEMLGKISRGSDSESLGNSYGSGSTYKSGGLFNTYSKYGSEYSSTSAFCSTASSPPEIMIKKDGTSYSVGLLTVNRSARTQGQRINPHVLKAWLASK